MNKYTKTKRAPLPVCPRPQHINAIQFQLFDNGDKPGRGMSQHVMKVEVYCDGRLDMTKPTWKRSIPLLDPKKFIAWVERERKAGKIDDARYGEYMDHYTAVVAASKEEDVEFAKLGHVGSSDGGTTYYVGQFISVVKLLGAGLILSLMIDGERFEAERFFYDRRWRPTGKVRKFSGMYDPLDMYGAAKREREVIQDVINRRAAAEAGD